MAIADTWEESSCLGDELHRNVDKSRWCVERQDLADFRRLVGTAIQEGRIQPSDLDPFDPNDAHIGPNIYTVNDQYIKPVTRDAGMMSWALMLHPGGLPCDLYITHAWAEGVFEFIDKTLHSWPQKARHAYCCMLANPQNLDISDLIRTPQESPFAVALSSARYMLVIPNQRVSVYMRLWCAYEAFLAYNSNMEIVVARAPNSAPVIRACAMALLAAVGGALTGVLRHFTPGSSLTAFESISFWPILLAPPILSLLLGDRRWRCLFNSVGAFMTAYFAAVAHMRHAWIASHWIKHTGSAPILSCRILLLCGCFFYIVAEADRVREKRSQSERRELTNGYTGSIMDAHCSDPRDSAAISSEIGTKLGEVDTAIKVLIDAGIWTADLRRASEAGVDVTDAGHVEFAAMSAISAGTLLGVACLFDTPDFLCRLMAVAIMVVQIGHVVPMCQWQGSRAFAFKVVAKLSQLWAVLSLVIHIYFVYIRGVKTEVALRRVQGLLCLVAHALALSLSLAGAGQVARLPIFGRVLAQMLMARGLGRCVGRMVCCLLTTRCSPHNSCPGGQSSSHESDATQSSDEESVSSMSEG